MNVLLPKCVGPKMIILLFRFFGHEMIAQFTCPTINLGLKVKYFRTKLSFSRIFLTPQLRGCFEAVVGYLFEESYLHLLGQWSISLNLAKVRNTVNYFGTEVERLYLVVKTQYVIWRSLELLHVVFSKKLQNWPHLDYHNFHMYYSNLNL